MTTFGVYLSHSTIYMQNMIYHKIMNIEAARETKWFVIHFILCILVQFTFFAALEYGRLKLREKIPKNNSNSRMLLSAEKRINEWIM